MAGHCPRRFPRGHAKQTPTPSHTALGTQEGTARADCASGRGSSLGQALGVVWTESYSSVGPTRRNSSLDPKSLPWERVQEGIGKKKQRRSRLGRMEHVYKPLVNWWGALIEPHVVSQHPGGAALLRLRPADSARDPHLAAALQTPARCAGSLGRRVSPDWRPLWAGCPVTPSGRPWGCQGGTQPLGSRAGKDQRDPKRRRCFGSSICTPAGAAGDGDEHAGRDPGGSRMSAQRHTAQVPMDQQGARPGRPFRTWNRLSGGEERKAAPCPLSQRSLPLRPPGWVPGSSILQARLWLAVLEEPWSGRPSQVENPRELKLRTF